ncbi:sensor histidine kinase [Frondihabitans cladoniiphilus]|uniref:Histidine kinase/HSP90-like ATPase domain-containing protein n=1 Tax=Frondihabitans cladoniiphilus TaxID=715785 RepID=A0ABP8VZK5_9MICO
MLLGLPNHLAPQSSARAIARACHAIALVLLAAGAIVLLCAQLSRSSLILWPALLALLPMVGLVLLVERVRSTLSTIAYLVIGGAAVYVYAVTVLSQISSVNSSDAFTVALPKLALVMVGGSGASSRRGPLWATVGLIAGEVATQIAVAETGSLPRVDVTTLLGYLLIMITMGGSLVARERAYREQPNLHRAAREEQMSTMRLEIEQQASALVHDTVLSHLAAISLAEPGPLDPALRTAMQEDLSTLVGQEWLSEAEADVDAAHRGWDESPLALAVEQARRQGLEVAVTGDVSAISRLNPARGTALALAATQCFANVLKHSGTTKAELVTFSSDTDVTVMIIDDGVGFSETETPSDRLGVRNSIRARIERAGGTVQIWSQPGNGTSVMLGLPADRSPLARQSAPGTGREPERPSGPSYPESAA